MVGKVGRAITFLLLAGCAAPCEAGGIAMAYAPTFDAHLELLVIIDGDESLDRSREELGALWEGVVEMSRYQAGDGRAAYRNESVTIRFLASAPTCAPAMCDGESFASWERVAPERDDPAFDARGRCLWNAVPRCDVFRPLDALVRYLDGWSPEGYTDLFVVIVSARDDASVVDPAVAARRLAEASAMTTRLAGSGVATAPQVRVGIIAGVHSESSGPVARECAGPLVADAAPRLASFASAWCCEGLRPHRLPHDDLHLADFCRLDNTLALGSIVAILPYLGRGLPVLATSVGCVVEETLPATGRVTSCAEVAHLGRTQLRVDATGREVCAVARSPDNVQPGWFTDGWELRFALGSEPIAMGDLRLLCEAEARRCVTDAECADSWAGVRCDPVHGVCENECDPDFPHCLDVDRCGAAEPDGRSWCTPRLASCSGS